MAVANIDIKGNPKDFLAALDKSKKRIKEVRKDAEEMTKSGIGAKGVAAAAAGGAMIGSMLADAALAAVKRIASSSEYLSGWMAAFGGIGEAVQVSNDIADIQDRAKKLGITPGKLVMGERGADLAGGMGAQDFYKTVSVIQDGMIELANTMDSTTFGEGLEKLGLKMEDVQGLDAVEMMLKVFEKLQGVGDAEALAILQQLGFSTKTMGNARAMIAEASATRENMAQVESAYGGRSNLETVLREGSYIADAGDMEKLASEAAARIGLVNNKQQLLEAYKTEEQRKRAEQQGMYENAAKVENAINHAAASLDTIIGGAIKYGGIAIEATKKFNKVVGFQAIQE